MVEHDAKFDRPNVYEEGDRVIYRASSLGSCTGALVRARLGITPSPPSDVMQERFQEGHDWEAEVIKVGLNSAWELVTAPSALERYGTVVRDQAGLQVETEITWKDKVVRCHPDGIATDAGKTRGSVVVEAKFFGDDLFHSTIANVRERGMEGLGASRAWQASIEMLSTGLPLYYILAQKKIEGEGEERRVTGILDFNVFMFTEPCYSLRDVKMRVAEVEGWVARGELPPCPMPFDYPCGYWDTHEKREKEELDDAKLVDLVGAYARAKDHEGLHKAEAERIKSDIDARLVEVGVEGGKCGGWDIARTPARKGNVGWKAAYEATGVKVDVDQFRGAEVPGGIRMTKEKK